MADPWRHRAEGSYLFCASARRIAQGDECRLHRERLCFEVARSPHPQVWPGPSSHPPAFRLRQTRTGHECAEWSRSREYPVLENVRLTVLQIFEGDSFHGRSL